MEIKEDTYIVGIWFASWDGGDWMANVCRLPDNSYKMESRTRTEHSPDPWDKEDKKKWITGTMAAGDEKRVIEKMDFALDMVVNWWLLQPEGKNGVRKERLLIQGGSDKFMRAIEGQDWIHMKTIKKEG